MTCKTCGSKLSFNEMYDSFYCEKCNEWTEKDCGDTGCSYCYGRPEKPRKE